MMMFKWLKSKLGILTLAQRVAAQEKRLCDIEGLVQVGVDLHFKTPSWAVICLKGKNQDVVRFFDLPDNEISHVLEWLKELEKQYHTHPVFDAPASIRRVLPKW